MSVIETPYRASLEEQDDAGLWLSAAVSKAGADMSILLSGSAVNYAVKGHSSDPVKVGGGEIPHPMEPTVDLRRLVALGSSCFLLREDAEARGIDAADLIPEVETISRAGLGDFYEKFADIWHW